MNGNPIIVIASRGVIRNRVIIHFTLQRSVRSCYRKPSFPSGAPAYWQFRYLHHIMYHIFRSHQNWLQKCDAGSRTIMLKERLKIFDFFSHIQMQPVQASFYTSRIDYS